MQNHRFLSLSGLLFLPFFALLLETQPSTEACGPMGSPPAPTAISLSWTKKNLAPGCEICLGTATATGSTATSYQWQIIRFGGIDKQATTSKIWHFDYIEPDSYVIKVRAVANGQYSAWFSKNFTVPTNCCTQ